MNRQSTSMPVSRTTSCTQRDVIHAHGHTGSQKKSRSAAIDDQPDTVVLLGRDLALAVPARHAKGQVVDPTGALADPGGERRAGRRRLGEADTARSRPGQLDPPSTLVGAAV